MLQEAKGTNGKILGSLNYFSLINEKLPDKSLMKDKTKGTYFDTLGKGSAGTIKKLFSIPAVGAKIKQFLQNVVNTIANDVDLAAKSGCYATYENRKKLRECLNQLKKCGFTVSNNAYDSIKKLRRLEDFHNKIINLDFRGEQYPIEVWLEWKNGKNILNIHAKVCFSEKVKNEIYLTDGLDEIIHTKKQLVLDGFEKWTGNYKVFNSAEEGKQDIKVVCTAEEITSMNKKGMKVVLEDNLSEGRSKTYKPNPWSQEEPADSMILYNHRFIDTNGDEIPDWHIFYSPDYYSEAAKHEFGHILGIRDAYTKEDPDGKQYYSQYTDIKEDIEETGHNWLDKNGYVNMLMNNVGPIINNDIEMLILAWQTGKMQYFRGEHISEALGR